MWFDWTDLPNTPEPPEGWDAFERKIWGEVDRMMGVEENLLLFGLYSNATAAHAEQESTLTLERLQRTMNEFHIGIAEAQAWAPEPPAAAEVFPMLNWPACGIEIHTSRFLGEAVTPNPPVMRKGPYFQRRILRWRRAHPTYYRATGKFWMVNQRTVWCHPDDYEKLKAALAAVRPADKEQP